MRHRGRPYRARPDATRPRRLLGADDHRHAAGAQITGAEKRFQAMSSSARQAGSADQDSPRVRRQGAVLPPPAQRRRAARRPEPLWLRYAGPHLGTALAVICAGRRPGVHVRPWLRAAGQLLTITKPDGGTLSAAGIRCGTRGADCSARRPERRSDRVDARADAGFTFAGYTGDCAPGGRTIMTAPRTCGATFVKEVADWTASRCHAAVDD